MLGTIRVGADQQFLILRDIPVTRPDLLTRHHHVVAIDLGTALEVREVGARIGLREALTPSRLSPENPGQVKRLLLFIRAGDERGAPVVQTHEIGTDAGGVRSRVLLVPDDLLQE